MQNEYEYDDIGNRISASWGGDTAGNNLRTENYSANSLNQYTGRTNPGYLHVLGEAKTNATVTVNFKSTFRSGTFFQSELAFNNAQALHASITNIAVLQDSPNPDIVSTNNGAKLIPPAIEVFHYDLDGNMTSDGLWTNTWNGENRLVSMETSAAATSGGVPKRKLEFAYDPMGRRIQKTIYSWDTDHWDEDESHLFAYDGWSLLLDIDGNKAPKQTTVWGMDLSGSEQGAGGVGGLLFWSDTGTGTSHFAASDANGNVVGLSDSASATASATYEYDAFGKVLVMKGDFCDLFGWRFSSKYQDEVNGMLYFGFRFFNPDFGRWINRDPLEETGGNNIFSFVANKSPNNYEVLGLFCCRLGSGGTSFYNPFTHCCCRGNLIRRREINTGIKECTTTADAGVTHIWLEIDGASFGFEAAGNWFYGPGRVNIPDKYANNRNKKCNDYKLNPCHVDIKKFKETLLGRIAHAASSPPNYSALTYNCFHWVEQMLRFSQNVGCGDDITPVGQNYE